jgi:hypothetical protein
MCQGHPLEIPAEVERFMNEVVLVFIDAKLGIMLMQHQSSMKQI